MIIWITGNKEFINSVFKQAAEVRNREISIIQYTPHEAYARKNAIDNIQKKIRADNPELKTKIKPGEKDFKIYIKKTTKHEHDKFELIDINKLDPQNKLPRIRVKYAEDSKEVK